MMNKAILTPLITFAVGTIAGFLIGKKMYEKKYAKLAQEEIDSVKLTFKRNARGRVDIDGDKISVAMEGEGAGGGSGKRFTQEVGETKEYVGGSSLRGTRTNEYNKVKQQYNLVKPATEREKAELNYEEDSDFVTEEDDDDDQEIIEADYRNESVDPEHPYAIEQSSFDDEFRDHEKVTMSWYTGDDILTDEDSEPLSKEEVDSLIGWKNLTTKNTGLTHPNQIFIRNEKIGVDYEILVEPGDFYKEPEPIDSTARVNPQKRYNNTFSDVKDAGGRPGKGPFNDVKG